MNNIYIIHFGMGQKAMKAYECPLPDLSSIMYMYIIVRLFNKISQFIYNEYASRNQYWYHEETWF